MNDRHMLHVFAKYTLMSVGGMLANSCYILADTFFVAQGLGTQGLAALNLAIPVYNFVYGAGLLLGMAGPRGMLCAKAGATRAVQTRRLAMRWAWPPCARPWGCCWGCLPPGA